MIIPFLFFFFFFFNDTATTEIYTLSLHDALPICFAELADLLGAAPAVLTVTIPTPESRDAVRRAMHAARDRGSELLGVVENMVGGAFRGSAADDLAREFAIPVLGRVPFHPNDAAWQGIVDSALRTPHSAP